MMKRLVVMLLVLAGTLTMLAGCTGPRVRSISPEDNPEHHYLNAMNALEAGKLPEAQEKLERALQLDDRYSKGYAGLAIVYAERSKGVADLKMKQVEVDRAYDNLDKAKKYAKQPDERFDCLVALVRANTAIKPQGWLEEAEEAYKSAADLKVDERKLVYYQGTEALTYYMAAAYLEGLEFQKARDRFADVLNSRREGKWHEKADLGWKKTDRIVRAMAGITVGDVGKKIAVKDSITRADLAALLIDEMKLEKLLAGRIPVASELAKMKPEFIPADLVNSPFKDEVITMLKWRVRGMEPKFDESSQAYLFKPSDPVTRAEMAFILEDVLIKLTGDNKLATAYFGQDRSPFPDVRPTAPYYNAVMNMTTRGIIEGELSGEFRPADPVDGAEALLAIRMLNQKKNVY
ncbi:S-layer homology domain-containing protein [Geomonas sp. Red32]|uniref:S-layer homology domain-containing protein n=1 Tax=Geomonas sp. Red32 TaxID=2912856 RepID=UPI00202CC7B4|nr:S-layer homology domain-containing protein [Geomonas sp. Red32]MCM0083510.1 S-layer homology domain-containing protein [Geomonas sp. Red32]